jgi:hypothetical protein
MSSFVVARNVRAISSDVMFDGNGQLAGVAAVADSVQQRFDELQTQRFLRVHREHLRKHGVRVTHVQGQQRLEHPRVQGRQMRGMPSSATPAARDERHTDRAIWRLRND